jgi:hypothetical protein
MKTQLYCALATVSGVALALVLTWMGAATPARADPNVRCVNQTGTGCDPSICGECYATLQAAIDAAPGGQIRVAGGTYTSTTGTVAAITKGLEIVGAFGPSFSEPAPEFYKTVLDAEWGGSLLREIDEAGAAVFRLAADGVGHASGGWVTGGADFAEMLPAAGLEPGDVLVIGADGKLARSTEAYQSTVVGVYSKPGFVGGNPVDGETAGTKPLAAVGIVPTKVSAENGAIHPGDLLVVSSTPGHAMKASPNPLQGTVIGKALEKLDAGTGVIKILATLQ